MVRPSPSHGLQHTKLQASSITLTEYTSRRPNIGDYGHGHTSCEWSM